MRTVLKAVAVSAACLAVATPAFAEGGWNSTVSGAGPGFGSRTWTDRNYDSNSNYGRIESCNRTASIAFYRNRQYPIPDEVVGSEKPTCNANVFYRAGTAGDIHFVITKTENSGGLYGNVGVKY